MFDVVVIIFAVFVGFVGVATGGADGGVFLPSNSLVSSTARCTKLMESYILQGGSTEQ